MIRVFVVLLCLLVPARALAQSVTVTLTCPSGPPIVVVDGGVPSCPTCPTCSDAGSCPRQDAGVPPVADAGSPPIDPTPPAANRPPASRGDGFYVVGRELYDGNGQLFRMRGTNKTHQDNWAQGLGHTKSNTTRWVIYFVDDPDRAVRDMQSPNIGGSSTFGLAVPIPGFWDGTCKSDSGSFSTMVNRWVRDAKKYQAIEEIMVLNIANEWGSDHIAWRDAYRAAIPKIRAAGWHGAIMVDAPGCGQDSVAIINHGRSVFDSDPEQNVLFDWHIYGMWADSGGGIPPVDGNQQDLGPTMDRLYATGLCVVVGEFGPGRNIGPSPTMIKPERVIEEAERHGFGWLSWSWEDNDQANGRCSNNSFCHAYDPGSADPNNLTDFGKVMVPKWASLARTASVLTTTGYATVALGVSLAVVLAILLALYLYRSRRRSLKRGPGSPTDTPPST